MKEKEVNLRVWMSVKIAPSLFLFAYYWMCVNRYYKPIDIAIEYVLIGSISMFLLIIKSKRDIFDEFAKATLYKTDSICFEMAYVIMAIILVPAMFINPNAVIIGYLIAGGIVVLSVTRTIIFCVIDRQGM